VRRAAGGSRIWVPAALALVILAIAPVASADAGTIFYTTAAPVPGNAQLWSVAENGAPPELLRRRMPVTRKAARRYWGATGNVSSASAARARSTR
jgi:hypothetical protein